MAALIISGLLVIVFWVFYLRKAGGGWILALSIFWLLVNLPVTSLIIRVFNELQQGGHFGGLPGANEGFYISIGTLGAIFVLHNVFGIILGLTLIAHARAEQLTANSDHTDD